MRSIPLGVPALHVSRLAYGCMPLGGTWDDEAPGPATIAKAERALRAAIDQGITLFDHADIYARGKSETVFAAALAGLGADRDRLVLQGKCGIRFAGDPLPDSPARYDFSRAHLMAAVEGSLRRLRTDRLDLLLLHRPDPLAEPEEVASAFDQLVADGKVLHFGVSNHTAGQIALLRRALRQPLVVNQVELSLLHCRLIEAGILANQDGHASGADATLDECRLHGIAIQAWAPLARGQATGAGSADTAGRPVLAAVVERLARSRGVSGEAIALAWLLRHPAGIQPVIGSTDPARIAACCQADGVDLEREEWYALYEAARGARVP